MPTVKISIIVVSYNCSDVIEENIKSCIGYEDTEYILIDNNSSDDTLLKANKFKKAIHIIENKENKGFTKACNQGVRKATGEYIFLLNPDAALTKNSLKLLSQILDNNKDIGAVAPTLLYPDGSFQNYTRTFPTVSGLFIESFVQKKYWNIFAAYRSYTCQDIDFTKPQYVEQPAGAALMFRNEFILDKHYFIYGSDVDLCKQIINKGYKILQTPEAKVIHHQSKGGTENRELRIYLDADNYYGMRYFFIKNKMYLKYLSYIISFSFGLFVSVLAGLFNGTFKQKIKRLSLFLTNSNFIKIYNRK